jgi:hypothetical protein
MKNRNMGCNERKSGRQLSQTRMKSPVSYISRVAQSSTGEGTDKSKQLVNSDKKKIANTK